MNTERLCMEKLSETKLDQSPATRKASWITIRFILALILFLATLFVFVAITDEIVLEKENGFDQSISQAILPFMSSFTTSLMKFFTFFGSELFLFPAYFLLIIYYFYRKESRLALDITMIGLSSTGILFLFKDIFKRHRPFDPLINNVTGFSFPSGHSFSSLLFLGCLFTLSGQQILESSGNYSLHFFFSYLLLLSLLAGYIFGFIMQAMLWQVSASVYYGL